jgi:hypothetical protein
MVYKEIMGVHYENCLEHTNTMCGKNSEIFNAEVDGIYCHDCFE